MSPTDNLWACEKCFWSHRTLVFRRCRVVLFGVRDCTVGMLILYCPINTITQRKSAREEATDGDYIFLQEKIIHIWPQLCHWRYTEKGPEWRLPSAVALVSTVSQHEQEISFKKSPNLAAWVWHNQGKITLLQTNEVMGFVPPWQTNLIRDKLKAVSWPALSRHASFDLFCRCETEARRLLCESVW